MPKFVLILMVRNEERIIKRCMESVEGFVDAFCVCDTGSNDKTCEIVTEFLKTHDGCLTHVPWQNFGYNRSESFTKAQSYLKATGWDLKDTYGLLLEFIERESKIEDLRNEQMRSELSFLRSQISPHFIFNILNSIVYLIRTKADKKAEEVTIRLSSLMRYMLYDSDQSMVPLDREVEYVKNYIDLQRMRFEDDVQIDFEVKGAVDGSMIEPMLLIPFVENSFKHGVGFVREPYIKVLLSFQKGILHFEVENKIGKLIEDSKDDSSGIGLKNVKRRLELLYPNEHKIDVMEDDKLFKVQLDMSLNKKK